MDTQENRNLQLPLKDRNLSLTENMNLTREIGVEILQKDDRFLVFPNKDPEKIQWVPMTLEEAIGLVIKPDGKPRTFLVHNSITPDSPFPQLPELVIPSSSIEQVIHESDFEVGDSNPLSVTAPEQKFALPHGGDFHLPKAWLLSIGDTENGQASVTPVVDTESGLGYGISGMVTLQENDRPGWTTNVGYKVNFMRGDTQVFMLKEELNQYLNDQKSG